jgi:transposase
LVAALPGDARWLRSVAARKRIRWPQADDHPGDRAHHGSGADGFGAGGGSVPLRLDLSAWLGLTTVQRSTGGTQKLGQITKMGERTLRGLLVIRASAVIKQALICAAPPGSWSA